MRRMALVLMLAMATAAGCNLSRPEQRKDSLVTRVGSGGEIVEPKRCALKVAILSRPFRDEVVDEALWQVADEQAIEPEVRHLLEANGLRAGVITGDLPAAVESVMNAPPPKRVEPMHIILPDGDRTMISLCETIPKISLILNSDGRALGKDYTDASGWFRLTATQEGATSVSLRFVPELHHGPIRRAFGAIPNPGAYAPQQFMQRDGQQEDTLRSLALTLSIHPGQCVVIGCRAEANRSLGSFLFTQPEANSDRLLQKALLVWASRSTSGQFEGNSLRPPALTPIEPPK